MPDQCQNGSTHNIISLRFDTKSLGQVPKSSLEPLSRICLMA
jgi:hypothetical protein